jgi:hypothetical protein
MILENVTMTTNPTPTPPTALPRGPLRVWLRDCTLEGSGGLSFPLQAGVYVITPSSDVNPHDWDLHLPGGGHITVDARPGEKGGAQIS